MNDLRSLGLVAGREIREAVRRRSFWVVLALVFVGSTALMVVPDLIGADTDRYDVAVVDPDGRLDTALATVADSQEVELDVSVVDDRAAAVQAVEDEDADVAAVLGERPEVIVRGEGGDTVIGIVRQALSVGGLVAELEDAGLDEAEVEAALGAQSPELVRLDATEAGRQAGAFVVSLALYLLLLMLMIAVANGTAIEKANHISEVLLATVRPGPLLFGKVLGVGLTGVATAAIAAVPVVVKALVSDDIPDGALAAVAGGTVWVVLGLALYLTLAASLGALVERQEEVGSVTAPLSMLLVVTYIVTQSARDTPLGTVMAYFPLTSPLVMPPRLALGVSSTTEVVVSITLSLLAIALVARFGAVVYRRGVVRTGRRLKLREVLRPA